VRCLESMNEQGRTQERNRGSSSIVLVGAETTLALTVLSEWKSVWFTQNNPHIRSCPWGERQKLQVSHVFIQHYYSPFHFAIPSADWQAIPRSHTEPIVAHTVICVKGVIRCVPEAISWARSTGNMECR
jgi:hypothetical protein